jgi:hypothetical protein
MILIEHHDDIVLVTLTEPLANGNALPFLEACHRETDATRPRVVLAHLPAGGDLELAGRLAYELADMGNRRGFTPRMVGPLREGLQTLYRWWKVPAYETPEEALDMLAPWPSDRVLT